MIKSFILIWTCLLLFPTNPAHGAPLSSLMFSPKEVTRVLENRQKTHRSARHNKQDCLKCDGILRQSKDKWSVWINGEKLTNDCPQCRDKTITVLSVDERNVTLEWHYKNDVHLISLKPNQYYDGTLKQVMKNQ